MAAPLTGFPIPTLRIDELPPTATPNSLHRFTVMKDGLTAYMTIAQIAVALGLGPIAYAATDDASQMAFTGVGITATNVQDAILEVASLLGTGQITYFPFADVAPGFLKANGAAVSKTTFARLFAVSNPTLPAASGVVTVTLANPAVVSSTGHGLVAGDAVTFTTTGALPAAFAQYTTYYVIAAGLTANAFELSATPGGAAISTAAQSQSGVHTARKNRMYSVITSTTFTLPEGRGEFPRGLDDGRGVDVGRVVNSAQVEMIGPHQHDVFAYGTGGAVNNVVQRLNGGTAPASISTINGDIGTENRPRNVAWLCCIRY